MVSSPHEALHRIFRVDPGLFARLLPRAGIVFPEHTAIEPLDTDLTEIRPLEHRVDSVFRVRVAGEEGGFVLAVESQGITEADEAARDLGVAVFSALAYAKDPGLTAILDALASGVADDAEKSGSRGSSDTDEDGDVDRVDWAEIVEIGLGEGPGRDYWRHLMATYTPNLPGSNTIVEESWLEGRAKGKAEDILHILEVRGVEVPDSVRERVTDCTDLDVLVTWLDRSLSAARAEELFGEE
ncbi:hypothetical protein ABTZ21_23195 [Streptomyces sp. NPDC096191]|uniref:hypothetical protein n=1 Tax=Streptomyces sp. NPDC096191 TaxID=3155426 RepID=UPI0033219133